MVIADKFDLIGFEENAKRGENDCFTQMVPTLFYPHPTFQPQGLFGTKTAVKDKSNVYTLGERMQILTNPDPGIILGHLAEEQNLVIELFRRLMSSS